VNAKLSVVRGELCLADTEQRLQHVLNAIEGQYPFSLIVCMGHDWNEEPFKPNEYRPIELSSSVAMLYGSIANEMDWKDTIATFLLPGNKFSGHRFELVNMLNQLP
jgi:hypothetical protein